MMTDTEARELGERWLKAGGGYAPGMRVLETEYGGTPVRLTGQDDDYWHGVAGDCGTSWYRIPHDRMSTRVPDFRDGATKGAAMEVVMERWARPIFLMPDDAACRSWGAYTPGVEPERVAEGATEAACLVAALEAAPRGEPVPVTPTP